MIFTKTHSSDMSRSTKMDFCTEFVPVQMKFNFKNDFGQRCSTRSWVPSQLNVRAKEGFEGWLKVMCKPMPNDKLSPDLKLDLNIDFQLKCGPIASRSKKHVLGLYWTIEAAKSKLFFSFENQVTYDQYAEYLEKLLRSLENVNVSSGADHEVSYLNVHHLDECPTELPDCGIDMNNSCEDLFSAPITDSIGPSVHVADETGIMHEVQLRRCNRNDSRRIRRPIAILGEFLATNRPISNSSTSLSAAKDSDSIDDFVVPQSRPRYSPRSKKPLWNRVRRDRKWNSRRSMSDYWISDAETDASSDCRSSAIALSESAREYVSHDYFHKTFECQSKQSSLNELFSDDDLQRTSCHTMRTSPTFSTFGRVAKKHEDIYATVRSINGHPKKTAGQNIRRQSDLMRATYASIYGHGKSSKRINSPDYRCSSGYSSDSGTQTPELPSLTSRCADDMTVDDDGINSLTHVAAHSTSSLCTIPYYGSLKRGGELTLPETRFIFTPLNQKLYPPSSPVNIRRPIVIKPDALPTESDTDDDIVEYSFSIGEYSDFEDTDDEDEDEDSDHVEDTIEEHVNTSHHTEQSTKSKILSPRKLLKEISSKIKSKLSRLRQSYTDYRELAVTLISLPYTMLNSM